MAGSRSRRSRSASPTFAIPNVVSRIGGSPQHPVGNGLLAEQFPAERRGFAISAHIAGGNVGTVIVADRRRPAHRAGRLALGLGHLRRPGHRHRGADPAAGQGARHRPRRGHRQRERPERVPADLRRPRPALALPHLRARRRRARPRRGQPLRADLPDPGPRLRRGDLRADVRRAHRLLGADAAGRRLAVGPDRAEAADRRRLPRRRHRVRRVPAGRDVARLAVGRDRPDGPVQLRREPAAPGAARRHRAAVDPRRVLRGLLRVRLRHRVAVDGPVRDRDPDATARRPACPSSSG